MQSVIKLLPEALANQIAAGEVVQRPASVVKEMLENAIDAKAKKIELIIEDAGKSLIQVIDDGVGMSPADALMAFERHATSKIYELNDLFRIQTMGFRGEALASIAAVAQVKMKTRPHNDELGTETDIEGGSIKSNNICSCGKGTSIAVRNLFFNVPARRNFLKSNHVEFRHIVTEWTHVALAYPEIAFLLIHNGEIIYQTEPQTLAQRITAIHPNIPEKELKAVHHQVENLHISGYVGLPSVASKQRGEQYFFVNNRYIKSPLLHSAVMKVMAQMLEPEKHPFYVIRLVVPPETVDINIHPTKAEIKFTNEHEIYTGLYYAVRDAIVLTTNNTQLYENINIQDSKPSPTDVLTKYQPSFPREGREENEYFSIQRAEQRPNTHRQQNDYNEQLSQFERMGQRNKIENNDVVFPWESPPEQTTELHLTHKKVFQLASGMFLNDLIIFPQEIGLLVIHQKRLLEFFFRQKMMESTHRRQTLLFPLSKQIPFDFETSRWQNMGFELEKKEHQITIRAYPSWIPSEISQDELWNYICSDTVSDTDFICYLAGHLSKVPNFSEWMPYLLFWEEKGTPFSDEYIIAIIIPLNEIQQHFLIKK